MKLSGMELNTETDSQLNNLEQNNLPYNAKISIK